MKTTLSWFTVALLCVAPLLASAERTALSREDIRRMALETQLAIEFIEQNHYSRMSFQDIDASELIASYMDELDHARLFLLQSDKEEAILRFADTLKPVYLSKGELYPAFEIFDVYKNRARERINWIFERLEGDFNFTTDRTFKPDRSEMERPADPAEADDLWDRRITFELLQEKLAGDSLETAKEKIERRYTRTLRFIEEIEPHNVQETFLTSLTNLYDPHSTFFSEEAADEFNIAISQSLVGIGAVLRDEDGYCVVQELIAGGPAEMSGQIHPGDRIIEVAQGSEEPVDVVDMKLRRVVRMIRGEKGTEVRLTIIPAQAADPSARKVVSLIRDEIKLTENLARARIIELPKGEEHTMPFGVIELPSFYGAGMDGGGDSSTTEDVKELIDELESRGVEGIVLDLRRNGGGLLSEAINLTGLFIPEGPVVMVRDTSGQVRTDWDRDGRLAYEGPLVVLTSRNSASASEIVAGALRAHQRAIIIGDSSTHGKGTVQAPWDLNRSIRGFLNRDKRLGTVKVTVQKFYLPDGSSTQKRGVPSDIVIPSVNEFLPIGEADLPNVMEWDKISPADWDFSDSLLPDGSLYTDKLVEKLRERTEQRREELEEFALLQRQIEWFRERQERKEYSLNIEKRQAQREKDNAFRDQHESERDRLRLELRWDQEEVLLDLTAKMRNQHQEKLLESPLPDGRSKINEYYQRIFYYQPSADAPVEEIQVVRLDYERALRNLPDFTEHLNESLGVDIPQEALEAALTTLDRADRISEFRPERILADHLNEHLGDASVDDLLPSFFTRMIEYDPSVLRNAPRLDIPLRESIRILADWIELRATELPAQTVAARNEQRDKEDAK